MVRRPRVLFLSYPFPPSRAVGAVRPWQLSRHLVRLGWETKVVTIDPGLLANPDPGVDAETMCAAAGVQRSLTGHDMRMLMGGWLRERGWERVGMVGRLARGSAQYLHVDPGIGWLRPVLRACRGLRPGDVDVVLSTSPPTTSLIAARLVAGRLRVPYVLDYRDAWSLSPHREGVLPPYVPLIERWVLAEAAGIQFVSESGAEDMRASFGLRRPPRVITNGYEREEMEQVEATRFDDHAVVYAGSFYPPKRVIGPVVRAIQLANESAMDGERSVRLHYYGAQSKHVLRVAKEMGASECVVDHGLVPRAEALAAMKGALAVAVITTVLETSDKGDRGILTGKLFEAMGLGASVLLVAPPDADAAKILEQTGIGRRFSGAQVHEAAAWIRGLAEAGRRPPSRHTEKYEWSSIAADVSDHLLECANLM